MPKEYCFSHPATGEILTFRAEDNVTIQIVEELVKFFDRPVKNLTDETHFYLFEDHDPASPTWGEETVIKAHCLAEAKAVYTGHYIREVNENEVNENRERWGEILSATVYDFPVTFC